MQYTQKVKQGKKVKLKDFNANYCSGIEEELAAAQLALYDEQIGELQDLLYAAKKNAVLIVLQGMDTSGKDGTIKRVMANVNPQGCRVQAFKVPNDVERSHDFLWRAHRNTPANGHITIFNRSYYEDVLVVRVHDLVPKNIWQKRYRQINDFERLLAENGTIILKFYLHISYDEQEDRLKAREENTKKAWKLSLGDWEERKHWRTYQTAYEAALTECNTEWAPWHIIPANKKWFRNLAVAETLVKTLRPYKKNWMDALKHIGQKTLEELKQTRAATK